MDSHEREPCPYRIIDDLGGAFAMGAVSALYVCVSGRWLSLACAARTALCPAHTGRRRRAKTRTQKKHVLLVAAYVSDIGNAFVSDITHCQIGGAMFHSIKGARNAPRGERMAGSIEAVKANARRLGGSFAVWGGLFSTFDCCLVAIRNKEDPYNSIVSSLSGPLPPPAPSIHSAMPAASCPLALRDPC
jgi:hypothetical protein